MGLVIDFVILVAGGSAVAVIMIIGLKKMFDLWGETDEIIKKFEKENE